jgi:hypothetical protein
MGEYHMTDRQAFSFDLALLKIWCFENGFLVEEGEGWRPQFAQCIYHYFGFSKKHEGGQHGRRLAHDFVFYNSEGIIDFKWSKEKILAKLTRAGVYWESLNPKNKWGGFWTEPFDPGHFQRDL